MKKLLFFSALAAMTLVACQSYDTELPMPDDEAALTAVQKEEVTQITEDVNSSEVKNILGSLFGKQRKGRSADYTVSLLKDKQGVDRVICINYADNGGFALISAEKTHSPILAYADEGNFTVTDSLPFPLSEWMDCTMHSIAESESLPADSLETIARMWRKYDSGIMPLVDDYPSDGSNITWEEYQALTQIVMNKMSEWQSQGYRYYPINSYDGTTSLGDKNGIASYVQGIMYPPYIEEYRTLTFVVEKDLETISGKGHWMSAEWEQDMGYNQSFDCEPGSSVPMPVGCGNIAIGQIMHAYRYPNTFNWEAMTVTGYGNKVTSDFLYDVYLKCKAAADKPTEGTGNNANQRLAALQQYGYECVLVGPNQLSDVSLAAFPTIISSTYYYEGESQERNHAWVVEGGKCTHSSTTTEVWAFTGDKYFQKVHNETQIHKESYIFYVNWGNGGLNNGYYTRASMKPKDSVNHLVNNAIINIKPKTY